MALLKLQDFDANYQSYFDNQDIKGYSVYSSQEKIGSVDDLLVDEEGNFRYLVLNTGNWSAGKKVLLPVGRARFDYKTQKVYIDSFSRTQVENLPEYDANNVIDYEQEEKVRGVYRPTAAASAQPTASYDKNTYSYDHDPDLYKLNERDHQNLKLYEERLIANKTRQKTGEVAIGKRIETETQKVSIPLAQERIVVERTTPNTQETTTIDNTAFNEGEVARVEIYGETADIHKEAFVREEVRVKKVVDTETATSEEVLRREELELNSNNEALINKANRSTPNSR